MPTVYWAMPNVDLWLFVSVSNMLFDTQGGLFWNATRWRTLKYFCVIGDTLLGFDFPCLAFTAYHIY